jgi:putative ABC transport system substrate-binding protein
LSELGDTNTTFEFRWAQGRTERLAPLAGELVKLGVDVMVTAGTPAAAAASRATSTIPVVMATGVGLGTQLTDGASKPNANVTGISDLPPGVSGKRLTLLRAMVGESAPLALLCDRGNPSSPLALEETRKAAQPLGISVKDYWIASADEFGNVLPVMKEDGIRGFVVAPGGLFFAQRAALGEIAIENGLATITARREYAEAGCLMTYGAPIRENYRQAASYVSRILSGVKPADLPVDEPTEFDFVINITTAKALNLTPPPELLAKADIVG